MHIQSEGRFLECVWLFPRNTLLLCTVICKAGTVWFNVLRFSTQAHFKAFVTGHTMFYTFHSEATNFVKPCITYVDHVSLAVFCTSAVEDYAYKISILCISMFVSKLLNPKQAIGIVATWILISSFHLKMFLDYEKKYCWVVIYPCFLWRKIKCAFCIYSSELALIYIWGSLSCKLMIIILE